MKHVDPLSVLDILDDNNTNTFYHPHILYVSPRPPPSYMSLLPHPLPPNNTLYVSLTNPAFYPSCCCFSLQRKGSSALTLASSYGHTEIALALLATADIDVNHADVSIYPLTPSHVVVEGEGGGGLTHLIRLPNSRTNDLSIY